jgi:hypothetical protein
MISDVLTSRITHPLLKTQLYDYCLLADIAATLLLWHDNTLTVTGQAPTVTNSPTDMQAALSSTCSKKGTANTCTLSIATRRVTASSALQVTGAVNSPTTLQASASYVITAFTNRIVSKSTSTTWNHATQGQAAWSLKTAAGQAVTQSNTTYRWELQAVDSLNPLDDTNPCDPGAVVIKMFRSCYKLRSYILCCIPALVCIPACAVGCMMQQALLLAQCGRWATTPQRLVTISSTHSQPLPTAFPTLLQW